MSSNWSFLSLKYFMFPSVKLFILTLYYMYTSLPIFYGNSSSYLRPLSNTANTHSKVVDNTQTGLRIVAMVLYHSMDLPILDSRLMTTIVPDLVQFYDLRFG